MRKISVGLSSLKQWVPETMAVGIPGPPWERPLGISGQAVVLSPLVIKLPFDTKIRHELIVASWFEGENTYPIQFKVLIDPTKEEKRLLWNTTSQPTWEAFQDLLGHPKMHDITPGRAFKLSPVAIPKPWGKEVWFTGIEERGVSGLELAPKVTCILPILLACLGPGAIRKSDRLPILLKILDPKPNPRTGSLYFELHQEKQEVYIVSKIHPEAWPDGVGRMKYGVSQKERLNFKNLNDYKKAFQSLCQDYEACRAEIVNEWDKKKLAQGLMQSDGISDSLLETWYQSLPRDLIQKELSLQKKLDQFTGWLNLTVGDVVKVQKTVPHSLQHGITVIEFQTPVYERFIITFNQKVLTQSHWDIDKAFEIMTMEEPLPQTLKVIEQNEAILMEEAVSFEAFDVIRVHQKQPQWTLDLSNFGHGLIFALKGKIEVHGATKLVLDSGDACFLPAALNKVSIVAKSEETVWLLGREKLSAEKF